MMSYSGTIHLLGVPEAASGIDEIIGKVSGTLELLSGDVNLHWRYTTKA